MLLTLQTKKQYRNFGLAFGIASLAIQILPLFYAMATKDNVQINIIGRFVISFFGAPTILFFGLALLKSYKEKALFWIGILGVWLTVMLNIYIFKWGEEVYLQNILHDLSRKVMAMILGLLAIRYFIQSKNFIHLIIGFSVIILMTVTNSVLQTYKILPIGDILEQSLLGAMFYVLTLGFGYILFKIFSSKDDAEDDLAEDLFTPFSKAHLVFYFMIIGLYFSDFWKGNIAWQTELNILFMSLFAMIGIIYFSKNIITIGMAITLISLIGRIIAFYQTNSMEATFSIVFSLMILGLFEFSRRANNEEEKALKKRGGRKTT
ncbi:hypothetical protein MY04_3373 [Flammeovirga sp. MY04]|uniref:hypothetical protein n=1 Tax=Flammeovirga sp. MY04 TaxID=1191459 RepID=UPI0008062FAE|nr:hypothetical protein [Flammeovirga sp. MY04]ANQ50735.1 hypothetical protein MY04_3373 [Flammeovirga sp. MY04]